MKQIENTSYKAEDGILRESIDLGSADNIENYKDEPYNEESYKEFYKSLGIVPKKR